MQISALPHQYDTLQALRKYSHVLMLGGVGSGKTFLGCLFLLEELRRWYEGDKSIGLITAISYGQLRRSVLTEVFKNMQEWGITFEYNQQQSLLTLNGSKKFFCLSVDPGSVEKARGITVGSVWQDESLYQKDIEIYNTIQGRIRDKQGSGRTLLTSSPNGFNWGYDLFQGELHNPETHKLIRAKTKDNKHILDSFYDNMAAQLDEKGIQQELEGEFVSRVGSKAYYSFDRSKHVQDLSAFKLSCEKHNVKGWIGLDINVDPYCSVQGYYVDGCFYITDETIITGGADTPMMIERLKQKGYGSFNLVPDSTYVKRQSVGGSDKKLFEQAGFNLMRSRNPYVIDRISNCNRILKQGRCLIDPKCKTLIRDLEQVSMKDNGNLDSSDKSLTHVSDAWAYFLWFCDPIQGSIKQRAFSISR